MNVLNRYVQYVLGEMCTHLIVIVYKVSEGNASHIFKACLLICEMLWCSSVRLDKEYFLASHELQIKTAAKQT